jgi:uncharacterized protein (DUF1330 family)
MPAAYLIADVRVTDQALYDDYRRQVAATVVAHGGEFLARGGEIVPLEGGWDPARIVVLRFPGMEALRGWYGSPEYQPLITLRQQGSIGRLIAVAGV